MLPTVAFIVHCWRMDGARGEVREKGGKGGVGGCSGGGGG